MRLTNLSLIVAIGQNGEIGMDNKLLFHIKEDMQLFKKSTLNKTIIMGRKTFDSLPGLLPQRKHFVLTNNKDWDAEKVFVYNTIEDIINYIKANPNEEFMIIGGAQIYKLFLPYVSFAYISKIHQTKKADSFFPEISDEWEVIKSEKYEDFDSFIYKLID